MPLPWRPQSQSDASDMLALGHFFQRILFHHLKDFGGFSHSKMAETCHWLRSAFFFLGKSFLFLFFLSRSLWCTDFNVFVVGNVHKFFFFSTKFSRVNPSIYGRNSWSFTISFSFKQKMAARFSQRPMDGHWPVPAPKFINKFHFRQQPKHNDPLDVHWIFVACHVSKRWPKHFYEINCRVSSYAKFQPARGPR